MHLTYRQVGRLSFKLFMKLYQHYKDDFDVELRLKKNNITYEELYNKSQQNEEWF